MIEDLQENPIMDRLKIFISSTGLNSSQFADRAGIPRPSLSQMLSGRNKTVNNQILAKLNEAFPALNIMWLLFGHGEMRVKANFESSEPQNPVKNTELDFESTENEHTNDGVISNKNTANPYPNSQNSPRTDNIASEAAWAASVICSPPSAETPSEDKTPNSGNKKISSIIVFYSDNSFKTFYPEA